MRLSTKVALALSAVVASAGGVAITVAAEREATEQRAAFRETNLRALELLALALAPAVADGRHHRAQAVLDNVANFPDRYPDVRSLEVVDPSGRVVADLDPTRFGEMSPEGPAASFDPLVRDASGELEFVVPIRLAHPVGVLRARLTKESLESRVARQRRAAALFIALAMASLAVVLYLLHRRLLGAPISDLSRVADALRAGKMDARAKVRQDDEIGHLARAFNEMADHVERYTTGLEGAVSARTSELQEANARLEEMAMTDALTGLCNRRHFASCGAREIADAKRGDAPVALVVADIDRFKSFNDRRGHAFGDEVLRHVADVFRAQVREMDLVARIGGEEFVVLMPRATTEEAFGVAERMRKRLEASPVEEGEPVTASFGVASTSDREVDLDQLLQAADAALYRSKNEGRNRVTIADAPTPDEVSA
jgi:diguanylate cyclase (GGDEF)-like protein